MSFFTTLRPVSGLTDQDLEAFVKQDMIDEYGAERILLRYSQLLNDLRKEFSSASQLPSIEDLCRNLSKIVVYPEFRQYYASSGFLSALCDLLEDQHPCLDEAQMWHLHRCVLILIE